MHVSEVLRGMGAIVERDRRVFLASRLRVSSQAVVTILGITLFYYVSQLVGRGPFAAGEDYFAYVAVGLATLHVITAVLVLAPQSLRSELVEGTFERLAASPLGPTAAIASLAVFPVCVALGQFAFTVLVAAVVFGLDVSWPGVLLALPLGGLMVVSFAPFALVMLGATAVLKQIAGLTGLGVLGLSLAGGVYYPPRLMPDWASWVTEVQPFTPAIDLMRQVLVAAPASSVASDLVTLFAFALVGSPLAWAFLGRCVTRCRRAGTLLEA